MVMTVSERLAWTARLICSRLPAIVACCGLFAGFPAMAQVEFGGLYGTVADREETSLPGVTVFLAGPGATQRQISDSQGRFRFPRLDPGSYRLTAALDGYSPLEHTLIDIRAGRNTTLILEMAAAIEDAITVAGEAPLLDERKLSQGALVSRIELERIPTSGDPWALVNQAPGAIIDQIDVGGSDNFQNRYTTPGVGTRQNAWLIDGVEITPMTAVFFSPTFYDMEQFDQVELSTGGNDLSKATAGLSINMVTRRGTNEFRGSGRYFLTDKDLFWFFKQSSPNVDRDDFPPQQGTNVEPTQVDRIEDYGLEAGGPMVRDRLWIWGSYGRNNYSATEAGGFPEVNHTEKFAVKLNAQLSDANSLLASWNDSDKKAASVNLSPGRSLEAALDQRGPGATIAKIEDSHVFSSQLFLTGTWADVDGEFSTIANGCLVAGSCEAAGEALLDANGVWQNSFRSGFTRYPSSEWKVDGAYFLATGQTSHELKFGGRFREFRAESPYFWPGGRNIAHLAGEILGLPDGLGLFFAQRGEGPPVRLDYTSIWVQDTLAFGNWTINAGLRYDLQRGENSPLSVPANPALPEYLPALDFEGNDGGGFDWQSVSPRIGVTYALGEERRTVLRASYSQFAGSLAANHIARLNPVGEAFGNFIFVDANGNDMWDGREEDFFLVSGDGYDTDDPTDLSSPNKTSPNLDPEITDEVVLGVEHALRPDLVVGLSGTWRNTSNILDSRSFLRELESDTERVARREDYVFWESVEVNQPDGRPYIVDYFTLDPARFEFTGGNLLRNGDREVEYLGASLTMAKRLSNRWMLRAFINYGEATWDIPESFFEFDDPTDADAFFIDGTDHDDFDNDGDLFTEGAGRFGQLLLQSTWSFNVNGMYQIAPERVWGFNVAANIYGREGYPRPLYTQRFSPDVGTKFAQAMVSADDFRYENVYTVDLRVEKEFGAWGSSSFVLSADVFNALNEGYVLQRESGVNLPTANFVLETLSPRIWRLGVRFNWR